MSWLILLLPMVLLVALIVAPRTFPVVTDGSARWRSAPAPTRP
ncbi:MAG TPA: hypothetical protein VFC19_29770 [Candidatus Limnocylindrales bacterium]|nr:hypothetical protein [Candidatus Limnocylindrales bacterium]